VYSNADCIAYVISKLKDNGFFIKYLHPNTIFVSWENYVPMYVRSLFKKKTGMNIDERGVVIQDKNAEEDDAKEDINSKIFNDRNNTQINTKEQKQYTPINKYKPVGNLIYNSDLLNKINDKINYDENDI
jgi:hypothetical protein